MKIYLASANLDDIRWAASRRLIDGVITTHSILAQENPDNEREHLLELCRATEGAVFVTVHALTAADIYRDARELARLSDQIVVQVPLLEESVEAIHRLTTDGVRVAATLVYGGAQAILASRVGATAVVVSIDDLDGAGHDAIGVLRDLRLVLDAAGGESDVIALRPATATQFAACAAAGADGVAVSAAALRGLLVHPLTGRALDQLHQVLSTQHVAWSLV
jgi:transaldolase